MVDPTKPFFVGGNGDAEVVYADAYAMITGHIPLYRTEGVNCRKVGDNLLLYAVNLPVERSEEHTSELQSLMRISYAVFCLKKKTTYLKSNTITDNHP